MDGQRGIDHGDLKKSFSKKKKEKENKKYIYIYIFNGVWLELSKANASTA
jgi:hypothetical protein